MKTNLCVYWGLENEQNNNPDLGGKDIIWSNLLQAHIDMGMRKYTFNLNVFNPYMFFDAYSPMNWREFPWL